MGTKNVVQKKCDKNGASVLKERDTRGVELGNKIDLRSALKLQTQFSFLLLFVYKR